MPRLATLQPGLPGGASGKEPACQCKRRKRRRFDLWVAKVPWRRKWQPTPVSLPGKFHGQRSLAGYSPWGRKESDMTETRKDACTHETPRCLESPSLVSICIRGKVRPLRHVGTLRGQGQSGTPPLQPLSSPAAPAHELASGEPVTLLPSNMAHLKHLVVNSRDGSAGEESACNAGDTGDMGSIPRSERSLREGRGNPLQYSCLENPVDRRAWRTTVHGVTKRWKGLMHTHTHTHTVNSTGKPKTRQGPAHCPQTPQGPPPADPLAQHPEGTPSSLLPHPWNQSLNSMR